MAVLYQLPAVLSLLLLAAHFLRMGAVPVAVIVLGLNALLFVGRRWAARVLQVALVIGAAEWVRTTINRFEAYQAQGRPATRMLIILGSVAAVTLLSAALFETPRLRQRYAK